MDPRLKGVLAAVGFACLALVVLAGPAQADPMGNIFAGLDKAIENFVRVLIIVELVVIVFEAVFMMLVLKLPARTAFLWSFLANLISATLGSFLLGFILFALGSVLAGTYIIGSLFPVLSVILAILLAVVIEYSLLLSLDRRGTTGPRLLPCCVIMNVISLPLAYLLAGQLFAVMAAT